MKKALLVVFSFMLLVGNTSAQSCTPNTLYQDSIFGVWPDTITNLQPGQVGVWYSDTLNLIVPLDAGEINPAFSGLNIDSVQLTAITGLPTGIGIVCTSQTPAPCTMLPNVLGCVLVEGEPTTQGMYPIEVTVTGYTIILGNVTPIPFTFTGYMIDVGAVGLEEYQNASIGNLVNIPNPFGASTEISFELDRSADVRLEVFDLLGQQLWATEQVGVRGKNTIVFDGSEYEQGIYLYQITVEGVSSIGRMVLDR